MAAFSYRAVDSAGRNAKGFIEAASASAARKLLRDRALLPLAVERTGSGRSAPGPAAAGRSETVAPGSVSRVGTRAQVLLTRQMATLIGSGVRIEEALKTIADQSGQTGVTTLVLNLRAAVLDGRSLAAALDAYPAVFDAFYRASVRAGEISGKLGEVMDHLADHVEKRAANRQTMMLALLYPALLALVSVGVIVALLAFVVPDIVRVFSSRGAELPLLTRSLIAVSEGIVRHGLAMAVGVGATGLAVAALLRAPARRQAWHRLVTRMPGVGGLVRQASAAQYASTLATLVVSRVQLHDALLAAATTVPNLYIRGRTAQIAARVSDGAPLARSMREADVFPPLMIAMVASGEASGKLGETLTRAADQQSRSIDATVATIVGLVEPGVLLVMGLIVMLLVLAILMPIIGLNQIIE